MFAHFKIRIASAPLVLVLPALASCTADRGLMISEVGVGALELYLDEPPDHRLNLSDHVLEVHTEVPDPADPMRTVPYTRTFDLFGSLAGGEYLVIWEEPGRTGLAASRSYASFDGDVPGIAVEPGTLGPFTILPDGRAAVDNTRPYSYRIHASRYRYVFPFFYAKDVTDDVVTFGPRPRPAIGGAFTETGALDSVARTRAASFARGQVVWRKTRNTPNGDVPRDTDSEDDWRQDEESFGKAE